MTWAREADIAHLTVVAESGYGGLGNRELSGPRGGADMLCPIATAVIASLARNIGKPAGSGDGLMR